MRGRHSDTVDPGRNAAALRADITQDSPDGYRAQNNSNCQDDHKLWNFGCSLSNNINNLLSPDGVIKKDGLETAANRHPGKGFQDAVDQRVKQQDHDRTEQKRHGQQGDAHGQALHLFF